MQQPTGNLLVRVSAAQQAYPVPGAMVSVFAADDSSGMPLATSVTDQSGQSTLFILPAPPASSSESPGLSNPYRAYSVRVTHPDYSDVRVDNVSIFPGITAVLPVSLIPASLGENTTVHIETGPSGAGGANA